MDFLISKWPLYFSFYDGPTEVSDKPALVRAAEDGGDPHILCVASEIHRPELIHELCTLANKNLDAAAERDRLKAENAELLRLVTELLPCADTASYCELCGQHAPKTRAGELIGQVEHSPDCDVLKASTLLAKHSKGAA